jgi:ABC-type nitrate/sulfonate/bicarbonate transport system ATPase subunit
MTEAIEREGGGLDEPKGTEPSSLSFRGVSKRFPSPDGGEVLALDHFSLDVRPREMVSLIGPSGCGKSTLLRMVAGLDTPSDGELRVDGRPITGPCAERGFMFQDHNLFPWLTIRRNIQSGLVARGLLRKHRQDVEGFLRLVGLEGFGHLYPHQLSGGMAQRAALARALINRPKVLLLDEPLGALDQFTRMRMQDEVIRLWKDRGTTMILVTHDIDEAIYMSDRIAVMTPRPGRIDQLIEVDLPRPRQRNSEEFLHLRGRILEMLHFEGGSETA